jgi:hypothetical protein
MSGAKGYALGLMIEILSSRLTGMPYGAHIVRKFDDWENRAFMGHYVQAIDIEAFCSVKEFKKRMDELLADLKNQPAHQGASTAGRLPNKRRRRQAASSTGRGVGGFFSSLKREAGELKIRRRCCYDACNERAGILSLRRCDSRRMYDSVEPSWP